MNPHAQSQTNNQTNSHTGDGQPASDASRLGEAQHGKQSTAKPQRGGHTHDRLGGALC